MSCSNWELLSVGSDESGKGDFFGGPTFAIVHLTAESLSALKKKHFYIDIKDSKQCHDSWIVRFAPEIMKLCKYEVTVMKTEFYNHIYSLRNNMNALISIEHDALHKKIESDSPRIIDAFASRQKYYEYLSSNGIRGIEIERFEDKADSKYLSVALASIIARYFFIMQIEGLRRESGVRIPFGNSYAFPNSTVDAYRILLRKYSQEEIDRKFVKRNFTTLKKIKNLLRL